jgi:hypothetical protein
MALNINTTPEIRPERKGRFASGQVVYDAYRRRYDQLTEQDIWFWERGLSNGEYTALSDREKGPNS